MDLADARRLKELEKENTELKTILAESLLKNRVLEAVNSKNGRPLKSATPFDTRELRSPKLVETAGIEPEDESPVNTADMGKKGGKFPTIQGVARIGWSK